MIEHSYGFSEIGNFEEIKEKFFEAMEQGDSTIKALHIGSFQELIEKKNEINLAKRVNDLEEQIEKIKADVLTSDIIDLPTPEDIRRFCKGE